MTKTERKLIEDLTIAVSRCYYDDGSLNSYVLSRINLSLGSLSANLLHEARYFADSALNSSDLS